MRYVLAFLPPDRLFAVVDALADVHVHGLSVSEAPRLRPGARPRATRSTATTPGSR